MVVNGSRNEVYVASGRQNTLAASRRSRFGVRLIPVKQFVSPRVLKAVFDYALEIILKLDDDDILKS